MPFQTDLELRKHLSMAHGKPENSIATNKTGLKGLRTAEEIEQTKNFSKNNQFELIETASIVTIDDLGTPTDIAEQDRTDHHFFEVLDTIKSEPSN